MLNKKSIKVLSIVLMAVMLLIGIGSSVLAADIPPIKPFEPTEEVNDTVGSILGIIQWGGIIAAVIIAMFIGIKYITSSPEGKGEIKKTLGYYVGGIVILLSASVIVTAIKNFVAGA